jgi:hypothetical protein
MPRELLESMAAELGLTLPQVKVFANQEVNRGSIHHQLDLGTRHPEFKLNNGDLVIITRGHLELDTAAIITDDSGTKFEYPSIKGHFGYMYRMLRTEGRIYDEPVSRENIRLICTAQELESGDYSEESLKRLDWIRTPEESLAFYTDYWQERRLTISFCIQLEKTAREFGITL